jgi:opacity protein-like surface antigen
MRRLSILLTVLCIGIAASARAQGAAAPGASHTYGEFVAGPTFGHNSDASFGLEAGFPYKGLHIFVEGGYMRNVTSASMESAATTLTTAPGSPLASAKATFTIKQPLAYIGAGVRYNLPTHGKLDPYVVVGGGGARVTKKAAFFVNGADVTDQLLANFGVLLGADLAGHETKPLIEGGVGTHISLTDRLLADVSYRYARIFLAESGLNTNRLQFGIGMSF